MRPVNKNVFERAIMWSGTTDLIDLISFANASPRYSEPNPVTGAITYAPAGVPLIVTVNGVRYLQCEAAKTNLNTYSSILSNAAWTKISSLDSLSLSNIPDPMGALTAYKYIPSTQLLQHCIYQANANRTIGAFFRNRGYNYGVLRASSARSVGVNLTTGAIAPIEAGSTYLYARAIPSLNGWWYFELTWAAASTYSEYGVSTDGVSISFAGNGTDGIEVWQPQSSSSLQYLGSLISTANVPVTNSKDEALIATPLVSQQLRDRWQWSGYLGMASTQLVAGDKRTLLDFADSGGNICTVWVSGDDLKVHVTNSNGADAILSAALAWTATTKWTVTGIRATGALTVAGPTGGSTVTGSAWNRPDGALYLNMDSSLANQEDGMGRIDPV